MEGSKKGNEAIVIRNGKTYTIKKFYFWLLVVTTFVGVLNTVTRPFVTITGFEKDMAALQKSDDKQNEKLRLHDREFEIFKQLLIDYSASAGIMEINLRRLMKDKFDMDYIIPEKYRTMLNK